jgi:hypothetical protein
MPFLFFLPILILFVAPIVIITILLFRFVIKGITKQKNSTWTGTLIDKKHFQKDVEDSHRKENFYTLVFQADDGEPKNLGVAKKFYDEFNIGDRVVKEKGKIFPTKC